MKLKMILNLSTCNSFKLKNPYDDIVNELCLIEKNNPYYRRFEKQSKKHKRKLNEKNIRNDK